VENAKGSGDKIYDGLYVLPDVIGTPTPLKVKPG